MYLCLDGWMYNYVFPGKLCFLVIRQQYHTVQAVLSVSETVSKQMIRYASR